MLRCSLFLNIGKSFDVRKVVEAKEYSNVEVWAVYRVAPESCRKEGAGPFAGKDGARRYACWVPSGTWVAGRPVLRASRAPGPRRWPAGRLGPAPGWRSETQQPARPQSCTTITKWHPEWNHPEQQRMRVFVVNMWSTCLGLPCGN